MPKCTFFAKTVYLFYPLYLNPNVIKSTDRLLVYAAQQADMYIRTGTTIRAGLAETTTHFPIRFCEFELKIHVELPY